MRQAGCFSNRKGVNYEEKQIDFFGAADACAGIRFDVVGVFKRYDGQFGRQNSLRTQKHRMVKTDWPEHSQA
jgi:hypothetical protein